MRISFWRPSGRISRLMTTWPSKVSERRGDARRRAAAPLELDRHPGVRLRRAVGGVHDRVDDVAVVERLLRRPALLHRAEHVAEHVDVAELGDLVADREQPAGRRLRLLRDVAAARSRRREHLEPGPQEMVHPDRPVRAGHLVAQVHPAAERPAHLELADRPRLEADEARRRCPRRRSGGPACPCGTGPRPGGSPCRRSSG